MVLRGFLKFLAALFAVLLVLGLILGGIGYFVVRNFDPNMFRSEFETHLTRLTGFRVELGDIQLSWKPQPQLRVASLKLYHPKSLEKILQSDQVRIDADLASVLQRRFTLSQVVIQNPEIFLKHRPEGDWNFEIAQGSAGTVPSGKAALSSRSLIPKAEASEGTENISSRPTQGWEFSLGKILVRNAILHITDETIEPAYSMEIKKMDAGVREKSSGLFHFTAGGSVFNSAKKNLNADGDLDLRSQSLGLTLRYGPEKAVFQGRLKWLPPQPVFDGSLEVRDLDLESVIPAVYKKGDYVSGHLSAKAQLSFEGANPAILQRSLGGRGTIEILDGALRNRNLVEEIFDRLSPVLSITGALGGELPPEVNQMLKGHDTPFQSVQASYEIQKGRVRVSEFRLAHPNYQLSGQGSYGIMGKTVEGSLQLLLSQAISAYLIKKIREMALIAEPDGRVMIPFRYSGVFPDAAVLPDLGYIASKILQTGAQQLLNQGLEQLSKYLERKQKK